MSEANESYDQLMDRCRRAEARVKEETDHGAHYEELWRKEHIRAKKAEADLAEGRELLMEFEDFLKREKEAPQ